MTGRRPGAGSAARRDPAVVRTASDRPDGAALADINRLVEAAVMTWALPERVKRLALPSYRYDTHDVGHLAFATAHVDDDRLVGVAAWEPCSDGDCPTGGTGLLLHGLHVHPARQRQGIGRQLVDAALGAAAQQGMDGVLVKAQRDAVGFFVRAGFLPLVADAAGTVYAHRLWRPVRPRGPAGRL